MRGDFLQHCLGQQVPQVPAVTDLDRTGQGPADRFSIGTGPVPAHDLDAGVAAQPGLQHVGLAAVQDIDPLAGLGVDQDGRIDLATAQREVTGAENPRHADIWQRNPEQDPQRGVPR